jgi:steroid delta-isomerase-like uncharacterized protein
MTNETLLHRWFEEVWNQGRDSSIDELMAEDAVYHGIVEPSTEEVHGPAGFRAFHQQFRTAFPDIHFTIEDALVDGDKIAVRCVVSAKHTGPGVMPAPTNRTINISGMVFARVKDGKLIEGWNNFDFLSLYKQLGMQLT